MNPKKQVKIGHFSQLLWNILTIFALIGIILIVLLFLTLFTNPYSKLNPFPPPTIPPVIGLPTATATQLRLPPTWTPTPPENNKGEDKVMPTVTITSNLEGNLITPQPGRTENTTIIYSFDIQRLPGGIEGAVVYPERGCNWTGVGGQVFDIQGRPLTGLALQVGGGFGNAVIDQTTLTGSAARLGDAGYEFIIANQVEETNQTLWIRLIDQARLPLSQKIFFDTYSDCKRNLIIVNFIQVR